MKKYIFIFFIIFQVLININIYAKEKTKVKLSFENGSAVMSMENNTAAKDFISKLPLTLKFEDFNNIEKICRLPEKINTDEIKTGVDPNVGDVTLYIPWNTLVFYYKDFGYYDNLVTVGHIESGLEQLSKMGNEFEVTMEIINE